MAPLDIVKSCPNLWKYWNRDKYLYSPPTFVNPRYDTWDSQFEDKFIHFYEFVHTPEIYENFKNFNVNDKIYSLNPSSWLIDCEFTIIYEKPKNLDEFTNLSYLLEDAKSSDLRQFIFLFRRRPTRHILTHIRKTHVITILPASSVETKNSWKKSSNAAYAPLI